MRSGTVLLYNCSGGEFSKLRQIFAMLRLRMRQVEPDRYHLTLEQLANGEGEADATQTQPLDEAMLVFCGVNNGLLHQVLEVIRLAQLPPIGLKAVLTQDNLTWDTHQLHAELLKEREAMANKQPPQVEGETTPQQAQGDGES